ncbi:MAG: hypothetical protein GX077_00650 [Tissierellia bacterium]|nr:hypothetical protein [Tissierellia bacterium]
MKRVSIIMLASIIVLSGLTPKLAYGENGYDKKLEELILMAKELFNITDEYDEFNSSLSSYDGKAQFYLHWSDSEERLNNISINMDIDGNIIYYSSYPSTYKEPDQKLPTYTESEAEKIAMDFISKIAKDVSKSIKLLPRKAPMNTREENYFFDYIRVENGIPYSQNSVTVSVNKFTGEVTSYYANWERDLEFPKPKAIISHEEAKEAYIKDIGLKLIYKTNMYFPLPMDANEESNNYLAYSPLYTNRAIDAFTGEVTPLDIYHIYLDRKEAVAMDGEAAGPILTPVEREEVDKLTDLFNEKEIEKIGREVLKISPEYELDRKNLYTNYNNPDDYIWSLHFRREIDTDRYSYIDIELDAKTGELISFYKSLQYAEDAKAQIDRKKALELAKEYIKEIQPDKINDIELMEDIYAKDNQLTYYFQFIRKTDGIYVENDRIFIGVDGVNKEIYSYSLSWYKGELPGSDNIIPLDKAYEILWDGIGLELNYVKTYDYSNPNKVEAEIKLVYSLNKDKPAIISATTGQVLDHTGKPHKGVKEINYIDIEDSYAKDKIATLGKYGVGFYQEEFRPKDKINQGDFIYLLWQSLNPYRPNDLSYEEIYKEFISQGYMKEEEKAPEKAVTKEEAIKYIIRIMKFDKVAELEGIYKDIFLDSNDISEGLKGYINIAYGLKILLGDGSGYIRPKYELKREDAANIIYNYMFN